MILASTKNALSSLKVGLSSQRFVSFLREQL